MLEVQCGVDYTRRVLYNAHSSAPARVGVCVFVLLHHILYCMQAWRVMWWWCVHLVSLVLTSGRVRVHVLVLQPTAGAERVPQQLSPRVNRRLGETGGASTPP